ncbi:interferon-inducible double-stranded RNA-dependent protein kinase activator A [Platysternon megacephalum]|uniref:Interferon-inducible double-stranded RNA-dependent protein kinase activator A n=1 Tax=Platysternon megacephalum TaxID=55544 RepID=A0A4D9EZJ5_9SAUR|nr:interferon-inducible double-stranded RNA-dependent protein kinase activator A [Platysternon megacephalum]
MPSLHPASSLLLPLVAFPNLLSGDALQWIAQYQWGWQRGVFSARSQWIKDITTYKSPLTLPLAPSICYTGGAGERVEPCSAPHERVLRADEQTPLTVWPSHLNRSTDTPPSSTSSWRIDRGPKKL